MTIAPELLRRIVEGALLAAGQPLTEEKLLSLIDEGERPEKAELQRVLQEIADSGAERGFELRQVASGWRYQVPEDLAPWVNRLWEEKPQKYSRAILETLAIIAYRQPITRGDIEEIRGVAVSSHIVKTLSERGWIKVVGQRDVPGKPSLYASTKEFLDYFNLRTLDDLPTLAEIRDIDSLNQALDLDQLSADSSGEGDSEQAVAGPDEPSDSAEGGEPAETEAEDEQLADDGNIAVEAEAADIAEAAEEIAREVDQQGEAEEEGDMLPPVDELPDSAGDDESIAQEVAVAEQAPCDEGDAPRDAAVSEPGDGDECVEEGAGDGKAATVERELSADLPASSLFADADDIAKASTETDGEADGVSQTENITS